MKTSYPSRAGITHSRYTRESFKKIILFFLFIVLTVFAFAGNPKLDFKDSKLETGAAGTDGAVYRFSKVDKDIDALVRIKGRSDNLVYLTAIDYTSSGYDKAWQPQVGYNTGTAPGAADWWMEFEITFVMKGTSIPVSVAAFDLSAIDIDGNGHLIREYISFYGLNSYVLESSSILKLTPVTGMINGVSKSGQRFDGPTMNFLNIDTSGTTVMMTANYIKTNTFTVRAGGVSTGVSGASERMYSLYFRDFNYNNPTEALLPVNLKSFNATLSASKAVLNWITAMESRLSHYVVERSTDGKSFDDIALIFANTKTSTDISYSYAENVDVKLRGLVYYRLKMVNEDGSSMYSAVKIIRLKQNRSDVAVAAYPNPVSSELRITIPAGWQNKEVVYDLFDSNGHIVKHFVSNSASQTETFKVSDVRAGTYVMKLRSGGESAVQQIVKSH